MKLINKYISKITKIGLLSLVLLVLAIALINWRVISVGTKNIVNISDAPKSDAIIILGAYVFPDGKVSDMLGDRLNYGLQLYNEGKAPKIIVTGDHGRINYDEVNTMRKYLQERGVKREDIFMDHAGFNTYESMYRARDIFTVKKAIIVTQNFHLIRALYIAEELKIEAYGVASDPRVYLGIQYNYTREIGASVKAFFQAGVIRPEPTFLGDKIPVWGNGIMTDDGK